MDGLSLQEITLLCLIGLASGLLGGAMGVGGGIIIVPALIFLMGLTAHQAQATSLAVLLFPIQLFGVLNYAKAGLITWKFVLIITVASLIGTYFGSLVALRIPADTMKKVFGVFILLMGLRLIFGK